MATVPQLRKRIHNRLLQEIVALCNGENGMPDITLTAPQIELLNENFSLKNIDANASHEQISSLIANAFTNNDWKKGIAAAVDTIKKTNQKFELSGKLFRTESVLGQLDPSIAKLLRYPTENTYNHIDLSNATAETIANFNAWVRQQRPPNIKLDESHKQILKLANQKDNPQTIEELTLLDGKKFGVSYNENEIKTAVVLARIENPTIRELFRLAKLNLENVTDKQIEELHQTERAQLLVENIISEIDLRSFRKNLNKITKKILSVKANLDGKQYSEYRAESEYRTEEEYTKERKGKNEEEIKKIDDIDKKNRERDDKEDIFIKICKDIHYRTAKTHEVLTRLSNPAITDFLRLRGDDLSNASNASIETFNEWADKLYQIPNAKFEQAFESALKELRNKAESRDFKKKPIAPKVPLQTLAAIKTKSVLSQIPEPLRSELHKRQIDLSTADETTLKSFLDTLKYKATEWKNDFASSLDDELKKLAKTATLKKLDESDAITFAQKLDNKLRAKIQYASFKEILGSDITGLMSHLRETLAHEKLKNDLISWSENNPNWPNINNFRDVISKAKLDTNGLREAIATQFPDINTDVFKSLIDDQDNLFIRAEIKYANFIESLTDTLKTLFKDTELSKTLISLSIKYPHITWPTLQQLSDAIVAIKATNPEAIFNQLISCFDQSWQNNLKTRFNEISKTATINIIPTKKPTPIEPYTLLAEAYFSTPFAHLCKAGFEPLAQWLKENHAKISPNLPIELNPTITEKIAQLRTALSSKVDNEQIQNAFITFFTGLAENPPKAAAQLLTGIHENVALMIGHARYSRIMAYEVFKPTQRGQLRTVFEETDSTLREWLSNPAGKIPSEDELRTVAADVKVPDAQAVSVAIATLFGKETEAQKLIYAINKATATATAIIAEAKLQQPRQQAKAAGSSALQILLDKINDDVDLDDLKSQLNRKVDVNLLNKELAIANNVAIARHTISKFLFGKPNALDAFAKKIGLVEDGDEAAFIREAKGTIACTKLFDELEKADLKEFVAVLKQQAKTELVAFLGNIKFPNTTDLTAAIQQLKDKLGGASAEEEPFKAMQNATYIFLTTLMKRGKDETKKDQSAAAHLNSGEDESEDENEAVLAEANFLRSPTENSSTLLQKVATDIAGQIILGDIRKHTPQQQKFVGETHYHAVLKQLSDAGLGYVAERIKATTIRDEIVNYLSTHPIPAPAVLKTKITQLTKNLASGKTGVDISDAIEAFLGTLVSNQNTRTCSNKITSKDNNQNQIQIQILIAAGRFAALVQAQTNANAKEFLIANANFFQDYLELQDYLEKNKDLFKDIATVLIASPIITDPTNSASQQTALITALNNVLKTNTITAANLTPDAAAALWNQLSQGTRFYLDLLHEQRNNLDAIAVLKKPEIAQAVIHRLQTSSIEEFKNLITIELSKEQFDPHNHQARQTTTKAVLKAILNLDDTAAALNPNELEVIWNVLSDAQKQHVMLVQEVKQAQQPQAAASLLAVLNNTQAIQGKLDANKFTTLSDLRALTTKALIDAAAENPSTPIKTACQTELATALGVPSEKVTTAAAEQMYALLSPGQKNHIELVRQAAKAGDKNLVKFLQGPNPNNDPKAANDFALVIQKNLNNKPLTLEELRAQVTQELAALITSENPNFPAGVSVNQQALANALGIRSTKITADAAQKMQNALNTGQKNYVALTFDIVRSEFDLAQFTKLLLDHNLATQIQAQLAKPNAPKTLNALRAKIFAKIITNLKDDAQLDDAQLSEFKPVEEDDKNHIYQIAIANVLGIQPTDVTPDAANQIFAALMEPPIPQDNANETDKWKMEVVLTQITQRLVSLRLEPNALKNRNPSIRTAIREVLEIDEDDIAESDLNPVGVKILNILLSSGQRNHVKLAEDVAQIDPKGNDGPLAAVKELLKGPENDAEETANFASNIDSHLTTRINQEGMDELNWEGLLTEITGRLATDEKNTFDIKNENDPATITALQTAIAETLGIIPKEYVPANAAKQIRAALSSDQLNYIQAIQENRIKHYLDLTKSIEEQIKKATEDEEEDREETLTTLFNFITDPKHAKQIQTKLDSLDLPKDHVFNLSYLLAEITKLLLNDTNINDDRDESLQKATATVLGIADKDKNALPNLWLLLDNGQKNHLALMQAVREAHDDNDFDKNLISLIALLKKPAITTDLQTKLATPGAPLDWDTLCSQVTDTLDALAAKDPSFNLTASAPIQRADIEPHPRQVALAEVLGIDDPKAVTADAANQMYAALPIENKRHLELVQHHRYIAAKAADGSDEKAGHERLAALLADTKKPLKLALQKLFKKDADISAETILIGLTVLLARSEYFDPTTDNQAPLTAALTKVLKIDTATTLDAQNLADIWNYLLPESLKGYVKLAQQAKAPTSISKWLSVLLEGLQAKIFAAIKAKFEDYLSHGQPLPTVDSLVQGLVALPNPVAPQSRATQVAKYLIDTLGIPKDEIERIESVSADEPVTLLQAIYNEAVPNLAQAKLNSIISDLPAEFFGALHKWLQDHQDVIVKHLNAGDPPNANARALDPAAFLTRLKQADSADKLTPLLTQLTGKKELPVELSVAQVIADARYYAIVNNPEVKNSPSLTKIFTKDVKNGGAKDFILPSLLAVANHPLDHAQLINHITNPATTLNGIVNDLHALGVVNDGDPDPKTSAKELAPEIYAETQLKALQAAAQKLRDPVKAVVAQLLTEHASAIADQIAAKTTQEVWAAQLQIATDINSNQQQVTAALRKLDPKFSDTDIQKLYDANHGRTAQLDWLSAPLLEQWLKAKPDRLADFTKITALRSAQDLAIRRAELMRVVGTKGAIGLTFSDPKVPESTVNGILSSNSTQLIQKGDNNDTELMGEARLLVLFENMPIILQWLQANQERWKDAAIRLGGMSIGEAKELIQAINTEIRDIDPKNIPDQLRTIFNSAAVTINVIGEQRLLSQPALAILLRPYPAQWNAAAEVLGSLNPKQAEIFLTRLTGTIREEILAAEKDNRPADILNKLTAEYDIPNPTDLESKESELVISGTPPQKQRLLLDNQAPGVTPKALEDFQDRFMLTRHAQTLAYYARAINNPPKDLPDASEIAEKKISKIQKRLNERSNKMLSPINLRNRREKIHLAQVRISNASQVLQPADQKKNTAAGYLANHTGTQVLALLEGTTSQPGLINTAVTAQLELKKALRKLREEYEICEAVMRETEIALKQLPGNMTKEKAEAEKIVARYKNHLDELYNEEIPRCIQALNDATALLTGLLQRQETVRKELARYATPVNAELFHQVVDADTDMDAWMRNNQWGTDTTTSFTISENAQYKTADLPFGKMLLQGEKNMDGMQGQNFLMGRTHDKVDVFAYPTEEGRRAKAADHVVKETHHLRSNVRIIRGDIDPQIVIKMYAESELDKQRGGPGLHIMLRTEKLAGKSGFNLGMLYDPNGNYSAATEKYKYKFQQEIRKEMERLKQAPHTIKPSEQPVLKATENLATPDHIPSLRPRGSRSSN